MAANMSYPDLAKLVISVIISSESWASIGPGKGGTGEFPDPPSLSPAPHSSPNSQPGN